MRTKRRAGHLEAWGTRFNRSGERPAPARGTKVPKEEVKWGRMRVTPRMCQPLPLRDPGVENGLRLTAHGCGAILSCVCWLKLQAPSLQPCKVCSNSTISNWNLLRSYTGILKTAILKILFIYLGETKSVCKSGGGAEGPNTGLNLMIPKSWPDA